MMTGSCDYNLDEISLILALVYSYILCSYKINRTGLAIITGLARRPSITVSFVINFLMDGATT